MDLKEFAKVAASEKWLEHIRQFGKTSPKKIYAQVLHQKSRLERRIAKRFATQRQRRIDEADNPMNIFKKDPS